MNTKDITTVTKSSLPTFEEYTEMIKPLWDSRWLTNMGKYHQKLETDLKDYLKVPQLSLMVNGHMALEMTIQAMNFPTDSEIITTPFTFISTTHAIVRNHLKPIFCDIKLSDYTIDEDKIENLITEKTVAILPVHVYGSICNIEKIQEIAYKYNLKVIYDAAHAFGETYNKKGIGSFGDASVFSFHATKVFNTIEGGAVTFSNPVLYERLYNLKNFGIRSEELVTEVGANAKMNEFSAAMGLCNLKHISANILARKALFERYIKNLASIEIITLPYCNSSNIIYSYGYFPVLFHSNGDDSTLRDKIYSLLKSQNILSRKYFYPITSDAACFKNKYNKISLENSRYVSKNILVLPLYPDLAIETVDYICDLIRKNL